MDTAVSFSRNGAANGIRNTNTQSTTLERISQGKDGISGFTTLAHEDTSIISEDGTFPIEKVACKFNSDRNLSQLFECRTRGKTRMIRSTTSNENDSSATSNGGKVGFQST